MSAESQIFMGQRAVAAAIALGIAFVLLATPAAVAEPAAASPEQDFASTGVAAQGLGVVGGYLSGIRLAGASEAPNASPERPVPIFEITSSDFWIETDHQEQNLSIVVGSPLEPGKWTEQEIPKSGRIEGGLARYSYDLFIAPLGNQTRITVQSDLLDIHQGQKSKVEQKDVMEVRAPLAANVTGSQELAKRSGPRHVTINGSFLSVFWEWDLQVESPDGSFTFPSGYTYNDTVSVTPELRGVGSTHSRQTFVHVNAGEMSLLVEDTDWLDFYLMSDQVAVEGRLVLQQAVVLGGTESPQDREFRGALHALIEPLDALRLKVTFQPDTIFEGAGPEGTPAIGQLALPDRQETTTQSTAPDPPGFPIAALLTGGVAGLAVLGTTRVVVGHRRYARLNRLMDEKAYEAVVAESPRLLGVRRFRHEVAVMRTVSFLKMDRADEALRFLNGLKVRSQPDAGTLAYLRAAAHARLNRFKEAAAYLSACLASAPEYRDEVLANSWFRPILGHPDVARRLENDPHGSGAYS